MNGFTHIIGGATALLMANKYGYAELTAVNAALAAAGALFPDLDAGRALITKPSHWLPFGIGKKISSHVIDGAAGLVGKVTRKVLGHRGVLHYPLFYVALVGIMFIAHRAGYVINTELCTVFFTGVASHLSLDWLTTRSIPLLAPLSKKIIALPLRVKTGGALETVIGLMLCVAMIALWRL